MNQTYRIRRRARFSAGVVPACALLWAAAAWAQAATPGDKTALPPLTPPGDNVASPESATGEAPQVKQLMADAEKGDVKAQTELANSYYVGIGVPKNIQEAIKWWRKAADQGDGSSYSILGTLHYQGIGVNKDSAEAIRMWHKGAEKYDKDAMSQLGFAYLVGDSVPKDFTYSYMWFNLAASNGDVFSAKSRDSVAKNMSADMVMEAQRLGTEWQQQHPKPVAPAPAAK